MRLCILSSLHARRMDQQVEYIYLFTPYKVAIAELVNVFHVPMLQMQAVLLVSGHPVKHIHGCPRSHLDCISKRAMTSGPTGSPF